MDSGQVKKPKFLICRVKRSTCKTEMSYFFYVLYIFEEKNKIGLPSSGAAGIQVDFGEVKKLNLLREGGNVTF